MNEIILNEKDYAEKVLSNSVNIKSVNHTLGILTKYYISEGNNDAVSHQKTMEFLCNYDNSIRENDNYYNQLIDKLIQKAHKYLICNIGHIDITKSELEKISKIERVMAKKTMFAILCFAKYFNAVNPKNNNWSNRKYSEIFSAADVVTKNRDQCIILNSLCENGFISFSKRVDSLNVKANIIDNTSPVALQITDFRNLGNQYLKFIGENYFVCSLCGATTKQTGSVHKYCNACAKEANKKKCRDNYVKRK